MKKKKGFRFFQWFKIRLGIVNKPLFETEGHEAVKDRVRSMVQKHITNPMSDLIRVSKIVIPISTTIYISRSKSYLFLNHQTPGTMEVIKGGNKAFICSTLELPWKMNKPNISCIPPGKYKVKKRWSEHHGEHLHILDVPNRELILIHAGNMVTQIAGCVLVGIGFKDIDNDGYKDVVNSRKAMSRLLDILPNKFDLIIN